VVTRDWDGYWLERAKLNATMSTCRSRHVGAVAVRSRRSFADGFNGNLPGATHCDDGGCERCGDERFTAGSALAQCVCVHAEQNVVSYCAREGIRLAGATVYTTTRPCLDCVKLMAVAGVIEVVYAEDYPATYDVPPTMMMRRFR
jgi:dCMP deaminase